MRSAARAEIRPRAPERELAVLVRISEDTDVSQRQIASAARVSLGMANLVVRTLVRKGYVRIARLNRKKVRYILTPAGVAEKTRKAYRSLQRTLDLVRLLKRRVREVAEAHGARGKGGRVLLAGPGEVAEIAELALRETGTSWRLAGSVSDARAGELVLVCHKSARAGSTPEGVVVVDLAAEIARGSGGAAGKGGPGG